jgi:hypothetical protein
MPNGTTTRPPSSLRLRTLIRITSSSVSAPLIRSRFTIRAV